MGQKVERRLNREARRSNKAARRQNQRDTRNMPDDLSQNVEAIGLAKEPRDKTPLEARNASQEKYLEALRTKSLIFATGDAGCGKTFLATAMACNLLIAKDVERIIVTRPVLQADEDLGFLPGDISEKFAPYFRPVYDVLLKRLGGGFLQYCLREGVDKVEIAPFAYMRGRTFENAVVILDEAQNVTKAQMKMFLTRLGENVTVIVNGDITQCDLPAHVESGLNDVLGRFEEDDMVGVVHFTKEDSVRSVLCQRALMAYA